jgi:hypothetical protein
MVEGTGEAGGQAGGGEGEWARGRECACFPATDAYVSGIGAYFDDM